MTRIVIWKQIRSRAKLKALSENKSLKQHICVSRLHVSNEKNPVLYKILENSKIKVLIKGWHTNARTQAKFAELKLKVILI